MIKSYSAGGVVLNSKGQVLVIEQENSVWSLPKGHVEEGEDALTSARREVYEESGVLELEFIKELGSYQRNKIGLNEFEDKSDLKTITMFLFKAEEEKLGPVDSETKKAKWIDADKVADKLTHPKDKEFFLKCLEHL